MKLQNDRAAPLQKKIIVIQFFQRSNHFLFPRGGSMQYLKKLFLRDKGLSPLGSTVVILVILLLCFGFFPSRFTLALFVGACVLLLLFFIIRRNAPRMYEKKERIK